MNNHSRWKDRYQLLDTLCVSLDPWRARFMCSDISHHAPWTLIFLGEVDSRWYVAYQKPSLLQFSLSETIASTILLILDWCLNRASCCLGIQFDGLFQKHYHFVQTFANGLALVGVTGLRHICRSFNSWGTIGLSFPNFILVSQILAAIVNNLTKKKSPIACVAAKWISRPYTCEHRQQLYRTIVVRRRLE